MRKLLTFCPLLILLTLAAGYAHAIGVGGEGLRFGRVGATAGKAKSVTPLGNLRITNTGDFRTTNTSDNRAISP